MFESKPLSSSVPSMNYHRVEAKIATLNKKAKKLGMPELLLSVDKTRMVEWLEGAQKYSMEYTDFTIVGATPIIEGYVFVAALDRLPEGNLIRSIPGLQLPIPEEFRTSDGHCDHCHTNRQRKNLFIVYSLEKQEYLQVGRQCLSDFIGMSVEAHIAHYGRLAAIKDFVEEDELMEVGGSSYLWEARMVEFKDALSVAFAGARLFGYRKSGEDASTKEEIVKFFITGYAPQEAPVKVEDVDRRRAENAITWLNEQSDSMDFIYNVKLLMKGEKVSAKHFGYVAGVVPFYLRAEKENESAKQNVSEYVGTKGQRCTFELTVQSITFIDGYYGATYLHRFVDANGSVVVWFSSADKGLDKGDEVTLVARVKSHEVYKGVKQTSITRPTIKNIKEAA